MDFVPLDFIEGSSMVEMYLAPCGLLAALETAPEGAGNLNPDNSAPQPLSCSPMLFDDLY